jgi:hypothetical protein
LKALEEITVKLTVEKSPELERLYALLDEVKELMGQLKFRCELESIGPLNPEVRYGAPAAASFDGAQDAGSDGDPTK